MEIIIIIIILKNFERICEKFWISAKDIAWEGIGKSFISNMKGFWDGCEKDVKKFERGIDRL